jgi:two-component system phosphate regulon response regulator PhoB
MARKKVLIVDDETIIRQVVAGALEADGWETVEVADGKDVANVASKESPDLVVLDMLMPGTDGLTAFKELRGGDSTAHIPIVLLSGINDMDAGSNRDAESIGIEAGVAPPEAFLNKPASGDEISQAAKDATGLL